MNQGEPSNLDWIRVSLQTRGGLQYVRCASRAIPRFETGLGSYNPPNCIQYRSYAVQCEREAGVGLGTRAGLQQGSNREMGRDCLPSCIYTGSLKIKVIPCDELTDSAFLKQIASARIREGIRLNVRIVSV